MLRTCSGWMETLLPVEKGNEPEMNPTAVDTVTGADTARDDARGVDANILGFTDPPPLGNCQVLVHAIDARDLAPRDSNNSSDPVVKIFCVSQCHCAALAV